MHFVWENNDLVLTIWLQTQASCDQIVGIHENRIKIRITAAPIDGKANKHLIKYLAKQFGVPKTAVIIEKGLTSRAKRVRVFSPQKLPQQISASKTED